MNEKVGSQTPTRNLDFFEILSVVRALVAKRPLDTCMFE